MTKKRITDKLGEVIEDLQDFINNVEGIVNLPISDIEKELHRLRRDFNEFIIDELVLIKKEGLENESREQK